MKIVLASLLILLFTGCSKDETFIFLMQASFAEQFSKACHEHKQCVSTVDRYIDFCFDRELALTTLRAEPSARRSLNTRHILKLQSCLATKAGTDYWQAIDMPEYILSQVK